jgi:hypothetical protein
MNPFLHFKLKCTSVSKDSEGVIETVVFEGVEVDTGDNQIAAKASSEGDLTLTIRNASFHGHFVEDTEYEFGPAQG